MFHSIVIRDSLSLALTSKREMLQASLAKTRQLKCVDVRPWIECGVSSPRLDYINEFCRILGSSVEQNDPAAVEVVVCSGSHDVQATSAACMLVGCYLILQEGLREKDVTSLFRQQTSNTTHAIASAQSDSSSLDGFTNYWEVWGALDHAVQLGWLSPDGEEPALDLEELAHYACPANGGVHTVVPNKLLFLPKPDPHLPHGQEWADNESAEGTAARRRFSAGFYASLLSDLGVSVAAGLHGHLEHGTAAAMAEVGIDEMELGLDRAGGGMLRALDRLFTLSQAAPGAVAVVCGEELGVSGAAETLVTAYLVGRHGFGAAAAAAWVRLVGAPLVRGPQPAVVAAADGA